MGAKSVSATSASELIQAWKDASHVVKVISREISQVSENNVEQTHEVDLGFAIELLRAQSKILDESFEKAQKLRAAQTKPILGIAPHKFKTYTTMGFNVASGIASAGSSQASEEKNAPQGMNWAALGFGTATVVLTILSGYFATRWKNWEKSEAQIADILENDVIRITAKAIIDVYDEKREIQQNQQSQLRPPLLRQGTMEVCIPEPPKDNEAEFTSLCARAIKKKLVQLEVDSEKKMKGVALQIIKPKKQNPVDPAAQPLLSTPELKEQGVAML